MGKKKTYTAIIVPVLIGVSLFLLLVLQAFWLKSSYERAFYDFSRETNYIFRNTVLSSVFEKHAEFIADSLDQPDAFIPDSLHKKIEVAGFEHRHANDTIKNVQIYVSGVHGTDSVNRFAPVRSKAGNVARSGNFLIRLNPEIITVDSITKAYTAALSKAGIEAPFFVTKKEFKVFFQHFGPIIPSPMNTSDAEIIVSSLSDTVRTELVHISPTSQYYASFPDIRRVMLREISPQILFSLFLTLITTISFVIIYRGLRSQRKLIELKNDFINNVTHELKTPVATVSVAIEALQRFDVLEKPDLTHEYLGIAKEELDRLSQLTDSILKASMLESKGIDFIPERVNIDTIIQNMISRLRLILENKKASISYKKEGEDFEVHGSLLHLTNLLHNLVDNALKYCSANPSIDIRLRQLDSRILITVKDNGVGIPKEFHSKIFEKFFRIPSGDVHNSKGYGLGLSYASSVVKNHNGTIEVLSEVDHGSEFRITLPRGKEFKIALP